MEVINIKGATRTLGERQGYIGLPIRDSGWIEKITKELDRDSVTGICQLPYAEARDAATLVKSWFIIELMKRAQAVVPPLRDGVQNDTVTGDNTPVMESLWQPSAEDIADIVAGKPIKLLVVGRQHPPVMIGVAGEDDQ